MKFDFGGHRITIKNKFVSLIGTISSFMFFAGILFSFICNGLSQNDNSEYDKALPEIDTFSAVSTVKCDFDNDRIYVCYEDAGCVNTYNFNGDFLWAVSIPSEKSGAADFYIVDNYLILNWYDAFYYDSLTGEFVKKVDSETFNDLEYPYFKDSINTDCEKHNIYFDINDVYFFENNFSVKYIVDKPFYYTLFQPTTGFLISVFGFFILAVIALCEYIKERRGKKSSY